MCWFATADLTAGCVVAGIGVLGMGLARQLSDVPLAALPVLLGAHQLIESQIWARSPGAGAVLRGTAVTAWTVIAFVVLPVFVPLVLLIAERERRRIQYATAAVGLAVAAFMGVAVGSGVHATDDGHVMDYGVGVPWLPVFLVGYLVATCVPFLTSHEPTTRELGVALLLGAALAALIDAVAFASVWCAFAAVVSVLILRRTVHVSHPVADSCSSAGEGR
jgi:hypothetical protein